MRLWNGFARPWNGFAGQLLMVVLTVWGVALADDTNSNSMGGSDQNPNSDQLENPAPETPPPVAPAPTSYGAIMQGFEKIGIGKPMEDLGFNIHGYVDVGYLYDLTVPKDITPAKTAPGDDILFAGPYKNAIDLDQVDLTIERDMVNLSKGSWDVGFKVEGIYGRDAFFTHSNGILDQDNKNGGLSGPDDQLDLLQAYVQLGIPVGSGITVEAGKFVSPMGFESIDPTQNLFYTHSYEFSYGKPYTLTGVLVDYTFSDTATDNMLTLTGGVTRGWNQSTYANNGNPDGIFQIHDVAGSIDWTVNLLIGTEGVLPYGPADYTDLWVVPEGILNWKVSDQFTISGDLLYGDANHQQGGGALVQWFSGALYVKYQIIPQLAINSRFEYYHDGGGVTTGVGGNDINYWEGTAGVAITPLPDNPLFQFLTIRPEVRYDYADEAVFDFSQFGQLTASMDVYWRF
ncbi:MAG: outer membrane beta-barrel protein [Tepidisphaeraceae bacterium]